LTPHYIIESFSLHFQNTPLRRHSFSFRADIELSSAEVILFSFHAGDSRAASPDADITLSPDFLVDISLRSYATVFSRQPPPLDSQPPAPMPRRAFISFRRRQLAAADTADIFSRRQRGSALAFDTAMPAAAAFFCGWLIFTAAAILRQTRGSLARRARSGGAAPAARSAARREAAA